MERRGDEVAEGERAGELLAEEIIERYEGGESVEDLAHALRRDGVRGALTLVEGVLERCKIVRHAEPGRMPESSPQGFRDSARGLPMIRKGEGWKARRERVMSQIVPEEVVTRYQEKGESLQHIVYELRRRGTDASPSYLKEILEAHGVPLRKLG